MTKLSDMYRLIGMYLELHGDKEVTSIATCCGKGKEHDYELNLSDVYDGPIGQNLYTGKDILAVPKRPVFGNLGHDISLCQSLSAKEIENIYRKVWTQYVEQDIRSWLDDNKLSLTNAQIQEAARRYVNGCYDCTVSYWENIENVVKLVIGYH